MEEDRLDRIYRISMKDKNYAQNGFTLIEMMVVIAIIALLVAMVTPAVTSSLRRGREAKCISNLRSFGLAWNANYIEVTSNPLLPQEDAIAPWLSSLYPRFISDPLTFICPSDVSRGAWGSKPAGPNESQLFRTRDTNDFPETNDIGRHPDITANSYMYEFSAAESQWAIGYVFKGDTGTAADLVSSPMTWGEVKMLQLRFGDRSTSGIGQRRVGYERTQFPLVRCFHHYNDRLVQVRNLDDNRIEPSFRVLNVAVAGNTFVSGLQWEYPILP